MRSFRPAALLRPATMGAAALALALVAASTPPAGAAPATDRAGTVDGWTVRTPSALGLRGAPIRRGAAQAARLDSTCFAVLRHGRLARDWNWRLARDEPREVFSITKSVTATLVGIAVRDGDLRLDDRVSRWVPQWRGTASEAVTVRHLLSNDSGRFWSFESDYTGLLSARSRTRYAVSLPQQYPPGSAWAYNNAAIQVLEAVLERATGRPVAAFARDRLFEPLGMTHSELVTDRADDAAVFYGMRTTCLDLARLGRLYLGEGAVDGRRLLGRSYVRGAVGRSSTEHNAAYGHLWWLNRPGALRGATDPVDAQGQPLRPVTGQLAPDAPEELYAALGFGGQVLLVDPTTRTMVVRLGLPAQPGEEAYGFTDAARVLTRALR
ncbi:class A beta-lactamase-related serine hydrolase [Nocardioides eburneiflavus]|uniref:Class A beta-lactamase-related serine hydrolase n=1 Tax=Nocardioides eburneiflavus TaxID=2518372 RepID=A0A4Z1CDX9_9ACTN|nr:serine hydrolase domain-containing protein [Nocardioides eburneiflavus]TGN66026.1 class A beta-lactamase-related serine hydrolase [Nocardioides eburneiflavus]